MVKKIFFLSKTVTDQVQKLDSGMSDTTIITNNNSSTNKKEQLEDNLKTSLTKSWVGQES